MELRVYPSAEVFDEINDITYLIAVLKNPQIFYNCDCQTRILPDTERYAMIATLENLFEQLMH